MTDDPYKLYTVLYKEDGFDHTPPPSVTAENWAIFIESGEDGSGFFFHLTGNISLPNGLKLEIHKMNINELPDKELKMIYIGTVTTIALVEQELLKIPTTGRQLKFNPVSRVHERCALNGRILSESEEKPPLRNRKDWVMNGIRALQLLGIIEKPVFTGSISDTLR